MRSTSTAVTHTGRPKVSGLGVSLKQIMLEISARKNANVFSTRSKCTPHYDEDDGEDSVVWRVPVYNKR